MFSEDDTFKKLRQAPFEVVFAGVGNLAKFDFVIEYLEKHGWTAEEYEREARRRHRGRTSSCGPG